MNAFPVIAFALTLGACASLQPAKAPGCHGALRPANPNGSVLQPEGQAPAAAPASQPGASGAGGCGSRS